MAKENLLREQRQSNESLRRFDLPQGHLAGIPRTTKNGVQVWIFFGGCYQASSRIYHLRPDASANFIVRDFRCRENDPP
jgi:hypothetical protein